MGARLVRLGLVPGLALGFGTGGSGLATAAADTVVETLARGDAHHAAHDYEGARRAYESAVALEPDGYDARARLAHVLNDLGSEQAAAAPTRASTTSGDAAGHSAGTTAKAPSAPPLFERALRLSDDLVRDAPERAEGHYWRAASLASLMPFRSGPEKVRASREVEASARRATELDPCLASAYAVLAITYRELAGVSGFVRTLASAALGGLPKGSLEDAEGLMRAATALDPRDPFAHYELALTLEARGQRDEAIAELRRSLDLPVREARDERNRAAARGRLVRLLTAAGGARGSEEERPARRDGESAADAKVRAFLESSRGSWHDWNVPEEDGRILHDLVVKRRLRSALEIGTSTGHSSVWIAWALSKTGGRLTTIEIDPSRYETAVRNFEMAGVAPLIDARLADAHELVRQLPGPFDFVFSDADKGWYLQYFKDLEPKIAPGGCFTAHNVLRSGGGGAAAFLEYVKKLPAYETTVETGGGEGISISCKRR